MMKRKKLRDEIPIDQRKKLAEHFDDVADANEKRLGSDAVQVRLQRGRARFLRGETDVPPGNAQNFNPDSLK